MFIQVPAFIAFGYTPKSGIAGSNDNSVFNFFKELPYHVLWYIPISNVQRLQLFHIFAPCQCLFSVVVVLHSNHPNRSEVVNFLFFMYKIW